MKKHRRKFSCQTPFCLHGSISLTASPRVFGDRVYLYGSHDRAAQSDFCDYKLKVWSAPLDDLNNWDSVTDTASIPVMTVTISPIPRE